MVTASEQGVKMRSDGLTKQSRNNGSAGMREGEGEVERGGGGGRGKPI